MATIIGNPLNVSDLASLKALTTRPTMVTMSGTQGGTFLWYGGDSTTANDATVVQCTSGPSGRYKRMYHGSISPRWFGCALDGVTDDTTNFQKVLNVGGDITLDGDMLLSAQVTCSVARTTIRGINDAKIISKAGQTGTMLRLNADHIHVEDLRFDIPNSPNMNACIWLSGNYYRFRKVTIIGPVHNPLTPNALIGPYYGIDVTQSGNTAMFMDGLLDQINVVGCVTGILIVGGRRIQASNISVRGSRAFGMVVGGGLSVQNFQMTNFQAMSCGLYGFSNSSLNYYASVDPVAMNGWQLTNIHAENCGWRTFFNGDDGSMASTKYGFDLTDNGMNGLRFSGGARNCAAGGLEWKGSTFYGYNTTLTTNTATTSGNILNFASVPSSIILNQTVTDQTGSKIPADTYVSAIDRTGNTVTLTRNVTSTLASGSSILFTANVQPAGHRNAVIDFNYVSHLDSGQEGIGCFQEDTTIPSGFNSNTHFRLHTVTEQAPAWRSFLYRKPYDICSSGGIGWMCFGDGTGNPGTTGQSAPGSGGVNLIRTTSSGTLAAGGTPTVLNFSGTGSGDLSAVPNGTTTYVFGEGIADGTTVSSHTSTTLTLSLPVTKDVNSGDTILIVSIVRDGALYWACMGPDNSGSSINNKGIRAYGSKNISMDIESIGNGYGLYLSTNAGTDNIFNGLKCKARVRGSAYGIILAGSGSFTNGSFVGCDVEATSTAFYQSCSSGTHDYTIIGGKFKCTGNLAMRMDSGSTNTIRLDGGVYFGSTSTTAVRVVGGTSNVIRCGAATFEGGPSGVVVDLAGGTGSWDFGNSVIQQNGTSAGFQVSGGSMTVHGTPLRQDLSTAPSGSTAASVGEYMVLSNPTSTEYGYFCQAASFPSSFTWKKLALT